MGKFCNLNDLSQKALVGHDISESIIIRPFNYAEQNGYLKLLIGPF